MNTVHPTDEQDKDAITTASPGPWRIRVGAWGSTHVLADDERFGAGALPICHVMAHSNVEAHARLIAASPDLLESLKAMLADIDSGLLVRDITRDGESGWAMHMLAFVQRLQAARTAIAKAEGGSR